VPCAVSGGAACPLRRRLSPGVITPLPVVRQRPREIHGISEQDLEPAPSSWHQANVLLPCSDAWAHGGKLLKPEIAARFRAGPSSRTLKQMVVRAFFAETLMRWPSHPRPWSCLNRARWSASRRSLHGCFPETDPVDCLRALYGAKALRSGPCGALRLFEDASAKAFSHASGVHPDLRPGTFVRGLRPARTNLRSSRAPSDSDVPDELATAPWREHSTGRGFRRRDTMHRLLGETDYRGVSAGVKFD